VCSPVTIGRSSNDFNEEEPCSKIVGAANPNPDPEGGPTAPTARNSADTTSAADAGKPRPNHSTGHVGHAHPESTSNERQADNDNDGSQLAANHARTSAATEALTSTAPTTR
jgi:hypothetical protein